MKHFYSHIIDVNGFTSILETIELSENERQELKDLMEKNLYHTVFDAILSELTEEEKIVFLTNLAAEDHTKTWEHLHSQIEKIEEKIQKAAETLKKELHKDLADTIV